MANKDKNPDTSKHVDKADPTIAPESGNPVARPTHPGEEDLDALRDPPPQDESGRHENATLVQDNPEFTAGYKRS